MCEPEPAAPAHATLPRHPITSHSQATRAMNASATLLFAALLRSCYCHRATPTNQSITNVVSAPPPPPWSLVAVQKRWFRAVAQANKPPPVRHSHQYLTPVPFTPVPFIFTQTATSANSSPLPTSRHCRQQRAPPAILRLPPLHALVHGLGSQPSRHIRSVLATPRGSLGGLLFGRDLVNFIRRLRESLHPACAEPAIPPAC